MISKLKMALLGVTALCASGVAAQAAPGLTVLGKADAASPVSFEVMLPLRNKDKLESLLAAQHDPASPSFHKWLSPAQFGLRFGPDSSSLERVATALRDRGFTVETHTRSLHVTGQAGSAEQAFGVHLLNARSETGHMHVVADGALKLPVELASAGASVIAFSGREAHPMSRRITNALPKNDNRFSNVGTYYFDDLKQAYVYPSVLDTTTTPSSGTQPLDGTGVTLGVLMENDALDSDIALLFEHENWSAISGKPDPTIFQRVLINGGAPFDPNASFEVSLDVQQELTGAPGSHVVLYNLPNLSDENIMAGYTTIIDTNQVDLVSSSFGECEKFYFPHFNNGVDYRYTLLAYHEIFEQGNAQGITFLASSGDNAGKECTDLTYLNGGAGRFTPGASSPAIDPNVTAVGGTNVVTVYDPPTLNSAYAGENAWSDPEIPYDPYGVGGSARGGVWGAGGGASLLFPAPTYQSLVDTTSTMRITPDIGMQVGGCPGGISRLNPKTGTCDGGGSAKDGNGNTDRSAVVVALGGSRYGVIGTSVASPELAGATALLIEKNGRMGNLNEYIYRLAARQAKGGRRVFHTNIPGYNGLVQSNLSSTYSVSVGVGTPIVKEYVGAYTAKPAGFPQTPSNP